MQPVASVELKAAGLASVEGYDLNYRSETAWIDKSTRSDTWFITLGPRDNRILCDKTTDNLLDGIAVAIAELDKYVEDRSAYEDYYKHRVSGRLNSGAGGTGAELC